MVTIADLGEIGVVGGLLTPIDFPLLRDGVAWNLTGYTDPELRVWDIRTKTIIAINGTTIVQGDPLLGIVRYTPGASDPIAAAAGTFEGRCWADPAGAAEPEASGLFRYTIGAGPTHS